MTKTDDEEKKYLQDLPDDLSSDAAQSHGGKMRRSGPRKGKRSLKAIDQRTKLERSRQSARECRARKKEKYQLLEEMVEGKEKTVLALRKQLEDLKKDLSNGILPKAEDIKSPDDDEDDESTDNE